MRLNEIVYNGSLPIDGYGQGFFRIGGQVVQGACLVLPTGVASWDGFSDFQSLIAAKDQSQSERQAHHLKQTQTQGEIDTGPDQQDQQGRPPDKAIDGG